jgi:predicted small secreted protein
MINRIVLAFFAVVVLAVSTTACHTVHGAGEDVESVGSAIKDNTP